MNNQNKKESTLEKEKEEIDQLKQEGIEKVGQVTLDHNQSHNGIHLLSIIGEIEGHENLSSTSKSTKYEHILPQLAAIEDSIEVDGVLLLLNTMGGDVEAGLAMAEAVAGITKPTVALVLGGAHSIGIPIAVSADKTFIAKSASMTINPVRRNGMIIGVHQSFEHLKKIQNRIIDFVVEHSHISKEKFQSLMLNNGELVSDIGTIVNGEEAVSLGLCDEVGTLSEALKCLHEMIDENKRE